MVQDTEKTVLFEAGEASGMVAGGEPASARLVCLDTSAVTGTPAELEFTVSVEEMVIGRDEECPIAIPCVRLSRRHARIFIDGSMWAIEDLNSTNGVFIDGQRVRRAWLSHGTELRLGPVPFRFEVERSIVVAAAATSGPAAAAATAGGEERTMMLDSVNASKAVLEAVRAAEPMTRPMPVQRPKEAVSAVPERKSGGKAKLLAAAVVIIAAVGAGGVYYYPEWSHQQAVARMLEDGRKRIDETVAANRALKVRQAQSGGTIAQREAEAGPGRAAVRELATATREAVRSRPDNPELAALAARLALLDAEAGIVDALGRGDSAAATKILGELAASLDPLFFLFNDANVGRAAEDIRSVRDLMALVPLIADFQKFSKTYPQVTRESRRAPPPELMKELEAKGSEFARLNKAQHVALATVFVLLNAEVDNVEKISLPLHTHWKQVLANPG